MIKRFIPIITVVALFGGFAPCLGQIVSYTSATTGALNSVATHVSGTALARVNGAATPGSSCSTGFSCSSFSSTTTWSSSLAAIEVTATPAGGYSLSVTGFSADLRRSSTGPASVRYAYSTDGGTTWTNQGSDQSPNNAGCGTTTTGTWTTSLVVSSPNVLKFRIYGFNASSTSGTFQILNLNINGSVTSACTAPVLSTTVTAVSCNGGSNGAINLSTSGGSSPFTYHWSNGASTQNIAGTTAGTYTATVTATGGCTATTTATVGQPAALTATISAQTNTGCGGTDAQATVTAAGGTAGYSYSWNSSPIQTTATATGLTIGSYTATVTDAHGCSANAVAAISILPLNGLSASSITTTTATLSWTDAYFSASYNVRYRPTGSGTWTNTTSLVTSLAVSGLTSATTYEFQVQNVCTTGGSGSFTASSTFTTLSSSGCGIATGLSASSVTTSGATLNWTAVTGAISYNIQYRQTGTTTWTATTSTSASKAITGLAGSTSYEFQVQTVCSGSSSAFSASGTFSTTSSSSCNSSLWSHVYNPTRLVPFDSCMTVTGTVANKISEADGDIHIRLTVDPAFAYMINSSNVSGQHGDLVVEPVCTHTVTQSDAIASCTGFTNTVYIPNVGEHVQVIGSYVNDNNHGWNEIHPVTSITIVAGRQAATAAQEENTLMKAEQIKVYPNPANSYIMFKFEQKPSSVVFVTVVDEIGRLAGQYQLYDNPELKVSANYFPNGKYYYSIVQDSKVIKGGSVVIRH